MHFRAVLGLLRRAWQDVASLATIREEAKTGHALVDTISEEAWTEEAWAETERKTVSHLGTPRDGMQELAWST